MIWSDYIPNRSYHHENFSYQAEVILGALATASAGYCQVTAQAIGQAVAGHVLNGSLTGDPESAVDLIKKIIDKLMQKYDKLFEFHDDHEIVLAQSEEAYANRDEEDPDGYDDLQSALWDIRNKEVAKAVSAMIDTLKQCRHRYKNDSLLARFLDQTNNPGS